MEKPVKELKNDELFNMFRKYAFREYFGLGGRSAVLNEIYEELAMRNPALGYYALDEAIEKINNYESILLKHNIPDTGDFANLPFNKGKALAVVGSSAGAGPGIHQFDEVQERANLEEMLGIIQNKNIFICRVDGDSMVNAGILDGALLFVERNSYPKPGEIIVATYDGELFVKRLAVDNSEIRLQSENPLYEDILVKEDMVFIIHGIVKGVFQIPA